MDPKSQDKNQSLKNCLSVAAEKFRKLSRSGDEQIVELAGFMPVRIIHEDNKIIYVTDEPEFIEILKIIGVSGSRRSVESQRRKDVQNKRS